MFEKVRIGTRLGLGFGLGIALTLVLSVVTIRYMKELSNLTLAMYQHPFAISTAVLRMDGDIIRMHRSMKDVALAKDSSQIDAAAAAVTDYEQKVYKNFDVILERSTGNKPEIEEARKAFAAWKPIREEIISSSRAGEVGKAAEITTGKGAQYVADLSQIMKKLREFAQSKADSFFQDSEATKKRALSVSYGLAFSAILLGSLLSFLISRGITKPLGLLIEGLSEGAEQVSTASGEISSTSQQLAEGASQQAAAIEEVSSSLEEMASMTRQNAGNAGHVNRMVAESSLVINEATSSMTQLMQSMERISRSSEQTQKIIKTIDEIAFQTNLLALNAAVEAARAGEAGAGFAVVADEVRNLAMRAAEASKNTANLIEGSVKEIKEGFEIMVKTGTGFKKVAEGTGKVAELIGEITAASQEQTLGIQQINSAVVDMDKVTQQNAASAEESAAATEELNAQAEYMKEFVDQLTEMVGRKGKQQNAEPKDAAERKPSILRATVYPVKSLPRARSQTNNGKAKTAVLYKEKKIDPGRLIPRNENFEEF